MGQSLLPFINHLFNLISNFFENRKKESSENKTENVQNKIESASC